ncbi:DegV family protein [Aerococcaceae bacterium DSM 111176]|nr:DegV family protein [Aerococcaceae bacterium DSM 111176]
MIMIQKTAIIVDSTGGVSQEYLNLPNVFQLDLLIQFGEDDVFIDTSADKEAAQFYQRLTEIKEIPKTSLPEMGDMINVYKQLVAENYEEVFVITLSSKLSGTHNTLSLVGNEFSEQIKTRMIDSKGTSYVLEELVKTVLEMSENGYNNDTIEAMLQQQIANSAIYCLISELDYLVKGGRLSGASAALGNMLRIVPLIKFMDDGTVNVIGKIRTRKRAYKQLTDYIDEALAKYPAGIQLIIAHADATEEAEGFMESIKKEYPNIGEIRVGYLTPVLGVHGGPGALGMGYVAKPENFIDEVTK